MMNDNVEKRERADSRDVACILSDQVVGVVDNLDAFCSTEKKLAHKSMEADWEAFYERVQSCLVKNQKGEWEFRPLNSMRSVTIGRHTDLQKRMQTSHANLKLYKAKILPTKNATEARDKLRLIFGIDPKQGNIVYLELYYKEKNSDDLHDEVVALGLLSYPEYMDKMKELAVSKTLAKQVSPLDVEETKDDILLRIMDVLHQKDMESLHQWKSMIESDFSPQVLADISAMKPANMQIEASATQTYDDMVHTILDSHKSNNDYHILKKKYQQQKQENLSLEKEVATYKKSNEELTLRLQNLECAYVQQEKQLAKRHMNEKKVQQAHSLLRSPVLKSLQSFKLTNDEEQMVASMLSYVVFKLRSGEIAYTKSLFKELPLHCKMYFLDMLRDIRKLWR